jgi:hypothetical protein
MKLESQGQPAIVDPTAGQVEYAVSALALPDRPFLILSRARMTFMQVALAGPDRFRIECRDGGRQPVLSARTDLSRDHAARVVEAYRQGGDAWRRETAWQPIKSWKPDIWDQVSLSFAVAGFVLMIMSVVASRGFASGATAFGIDPYLFFSIAFAVFMPAVIIDLGRFRSLSARQKVRTVGALVLAILIALDWIDRVASGRGTG